MKKLTACLLLISMLLCGCQPDSADKAETKVVSSEPALEGVQKYVLYTSEEKLCSLDVTSGKSAELMDSNGMNAYDVLCDDNGTRMFFMLGEDLYCWDGKVDPILIGEDVAEFRINNTADFVLYKTEKDVLYQYDMKGTTELGPVDIYSMTPDGKHIIYGYIHNVSEEYSNVRGKLYIANVGETPTVIDGVSQVHASADHTTIYYKKQSAFTQDGWISALYLRSKSGAEEELSFDAFDFCVMGDGSCYYYTQDGKVYYFNATGSKLLTENGGRINKISEYLCAYSDPPYNKIAYRGQSVNFTGQAYNGAAQTYYWVDKTGLKLAAFGPAGNDTDNFYKIEFNEDGTSKEKLVMEGVQGNRFMTSVFSEKLVRTSKAELGECLYFDGKLIAQNCNDIYYDPMKEIAVYATEDGIYHFENGKSKKIVAKENITSVMYAQSGAIIYSCEEEDAEIKTYLYRNGKSTLLAINENDVAVPCLWSASRIREHGFIEGGSSMYTDFVTQDR